jgi:protoporphyrinogen oxidase
MKILSRAEDIRFAELRRIDHAYVIFDHHYYESLEAIRPFLLEHRIVSAGRYGGWNYSSMEDALMFGREAAKNAQELLR